MFHFFVGMDLKGKLRHSDREAFVACMGESDVVLAGASSAVDS